MNSTATQLRNIYNDLILLLDQQKYDPATSSSLFKGPWGALLFIFYYEQYADQEADNAVPLLHKLYAGYTSQEGLDYSFCTGHTGPFWLLEHLNRHEFLEMDIDSLTAEFISAAIEQSQLHLQWKNFDFLHGCTGMSNFLLPFSGRPEVRTHLEFLVQQLLAASKPTPLGRSLPIFFTPEEPAGTYVDAFSLAHGSCAALILLAKIYRAGIAEATCKQLITECITFILQHKIPASGTGLYSMYPAILDGKPANANSRLAWCYGDLNVAWTLWYCGKVLDEKSWRNEALEIMHYNTRRFTDETAGVIDNCICHGSSGIAVFYRKFWFETKDPSFYECAAHWQNKASELIAFSEEEGKHGIRVWQGKDKLWDYSWDLLDGGSGVGLSLLSHLQDHPLPWDECFLLS